MSIHHLHDASDPDGAVNLPDPGLHETDPRLYSNLRPEERWALIGPRGTTEFEQHVMWEINRGRRMALEQQDSRIEEHVAAPIADFARDLVDEDHSLLYSDAVAALLMTAAHDGFDPNVILIDAWRSRSSMLDRAETSLADREAAASHLDDPQRG